MVEVASRLMLLIEYDLAYESLKSMKGQIVANFIVEIELITSMMLI